MGMEFVLGNCPCGHAQAYLRDTAVTQKQYILFQINVVVCFIYVLTGTETELKNSHLPH